jgi:hypothetical protein
VDNRQQVMFNRLEAKLLQLLEQEPDWKATAEEVAAQLDLSTPDRSSPRAFVQSLSHLLPALAREAVSRGMSPKDLNGSDDPVELVNNLLP